MSRSVWILIVALAIPACGAPESSPRPEGQGTPDALGIPKGPATSKGR